MSTLLNLAKMALTKTKIKKLNKELKELSK